jgi:hypothetical protein
MAKNALTIKTELPTDDELKKMFGDVETFKRYKALDNAAKAAGKVIEKRARELAPRSRPEDRKKRSKKQRESANWDGVPMRTTIRSVVRGYEVRSTTYVGPTHPHGNKAYFNQPTDRQRRHVLWGNDIGRMFIAARNWMVQAFEETKSAQLRAMKDAINKVIGSVIRG